MAFLFALATVSKCSQNTYVQLTHICYNQLAEILLLHLNRKHDLVRRSSSSFVSTRTLNTQGLWAGLADPEDYSTKLWDLGTYYSKFMVLGFNHHWPQHLVAILILSFHKQRMITSDVPAKCYNFWMGLRFGDLHHLQWQVIQLPSP
jgi:hypothetical protein